MKKVREAFMRRASFFVARNSEKRLSGDALVTPEVPASILQLHSNVTVIKYIGG